MLLRKKGIFYIEPNWKDQKTSKPRILISKLYGWEAILGSLKI